MTVDQKKEGLGLMLSLRVGERLYFDVGGERIQITAMEGRGKSLPCRIGIKADKEKVKVIREHWEKK